MIKNMLATVPLIVLILSGVFASKFNNPISVPVDQIGTITFIGGQDDVKYKIESASISTVGAKETQIFHGLIDSVTSDVLPEGTVIYRVPGVDPSKELAVKWQGKYRKVVRIN